jgi:hypothetical protein
VPNPVNIFHCKQKLYAKNVVTVEPGTGSIMLHHSNRYSMVSLVVLGYTILIGTTWEATSQCEPGLSK